MKQRAYWRTDLPDTEGRTDDGMFNLPRQETAEIYVSDNNAESKVLIYGPKGDALICQEPRPVGFRRP